MIAHEDIDNGKLHQKLHKTCCCPTLVCACNTMWYPCRKAVSGHKVRYEEGNYNLDLTYMTPRVIVHGFPAIGIEHMYRNPRYEVARLLETQHKGHYKVYNFCCEPGRGYDADIFDGRVERYPFLDHHTPSLARMVEFADSAYDWLLADKKNVVTMHCKAGKGRAGLMCCVLLLRAGVVNSAAEAFKKYDATRVTNNKGLTVTSQRKYVKFFEELWREFWAEESESLGNVLPRESRKRALPVEPAMMLVRATIVNGDGSVDEKAALASLGELSVKCWQVDDYLPELVGESKGTTTDLGAKIKGNFKIKVEAKGFFSSTKVCEFMHNTLFIRIPKGHRSVDFGLSQLDVPKKTLKRLGTSMKLRLEFALSSAAAGVAVGSAKI